MKKEQRGDMLIKNLDLNLLYQQKLELVRLLQRKNKKKMDFLWGIVHMIEAGLDDLEKGELFVYPDEKERKHYLMYAKSIKMCTGMTTYDKRIEKGYRLIQITKEEFDGAEDQADVNAVFEKYKDRLKLPGKII